MKLFNNILVYLFVVMAIFPLQFVSAQTNNVTKNAKVDTSSIGLATKVAPGELLPISVKLSNFGGGTKVDVLVKYGIFSDTEKEIYSTNDTVAVETTANFIKTVQIPFGTPAGIYTAKTSVVYQGQLVPATTQFSFAVEPKILGFFKADFFLYGCLTILVSFFMLLLSYMLVRRRHSGRFAIFDYSNIPHSKRTFYEILSDTIMQMRGRAGDDALLIASQIDGLKIEKETGRVLSIDGNPSKIIATLVSEYEKLLGKKVSFSFRKEIPEKE